MASKNTGGEDEGVVTIQCGDDDPVEIELSEVRDPDNLKELFDLELGPKFLHRVEENKTKITRLASVEAGAFYKIPPKFLSASASSSFSEAPAEIAAIDDDVEHVQNTLYCSKSVYKEDPIVFLNEPGNQLMHSIEVAQVSLYGPQKILLAESPTKKTLYVAFRGSQTVEDWMTNTEIGLKKKDHFPGKCNSGFMDRAEQLPAHYIIKHAKDNNLDTIITCGHSMGGAVSSVMALNLLHQTDGVEGNKIRVFNMTFGAPYFSNIDLQQYCEKKGYQKRFVHFTNKLDIVPTILSLSHTMGDICHKIKKELSNATGGLSNIPIGFLEAAKCQYGKFISGFADIMGFILNHTPSTPPTYALKIFLPILKEVAAEEKPINLDCDLGDKEEYIPNGIYKVTSDRKILELSDPGVVKLSLQTATKSESSLAKSIEAHFIESYENDMQKHHKFKKLRSDKISNLVVPCSLYKASISNVEFLLRNDDIIDGNLIPCHIILTGHNIWPLVPSIHSNVGLEFKEFSTITKLQQENQEIVKLETLFNESNMDKIKSISDLGSMDIKVSTLYTANCSVKLKQKNIRNVDFHSAKDPMNTEKIAHIVRKAVQRGVALESIEKGRGQELLSMAEHNLSANLLSEATQMKFHDLVCRTKDQSIIENEKSYEEIENLCNEIGGLIGAGMKLKHKTIFDRFVDNASDKIAIIGAFAYYAIGCNKFDKFIKLMISILEIELNYKSLVKKIYDVSKIEKGGIMTVLPQELADQVQAMPHDNLYMQEKVLGSIWNIDNDQVQDKLKDILDNFNAKSQKKIKTRIQCILSIHDLRNQLSQSCFIGFVGRQNAGKSTILNKIWNLKSTTGLISHTEAPQIFKIDKHLQVIDYPGQSSIEDHAHSASLCGSMNNLIFVVLPFEGNVDKHSLGEVIDALDIMSASGSANIVFCFNKCFREIDNLRQDENMKNELQTCPGNKMFDVIREKYKEKLNRGIEKLNEKQLEQLPEKWKVKLINDLKCFGKVLDENILFTDWQNGDTQEAKEVGISGVGDIKNIIRKYLIKNGTYDGDEEGLEACLNRTHL